MKTIAPTLLAALFMFVGTPCFAGKTHAPLSPKILTAKTVYVENHGKAKLADRVYDEMKKWGHWEIALDRAKADLILVFSDQEGQSSSGTTAVYDPTPAPGMGGAGTWKYGTTHSATGGSTHLEVVERETRQTLYADTERAPSGITRELKKRIEEESKASSSK